MNELQDELDVEGFNVQILGVNHIDKAMGNEGMLVDKTLPWLQDTVQQYVWLSWAPTYRDVIILDEQNYYVSSFNLTLNQLNQSENKQSLKALLIGDQAAEADSGSL